MLVIYSIIIISSFTLFGVVALDNYESKRIKNEEIRLFQTANIVADTYKANQEDIILIRTMVKSYGRQASARILILDFDKKVMIDNHNTYIGEKIDNEEIRSSLAAKPKSGMYKLQNKYVLQLAVPITIDRGYERRTEGAVLVSASMEAVALDVNDLKNTLLKVSISALSIALLLTIFAANSLTKPLRSLTDAVGKLSSGHLGYKMKNQESGEIGKLIEAFNEMSGKLRQIENNRKSFINSISHELKTPLTAIRALIDSLSMGNSGLETYKEYLEDIEEETKRMGQLVDYLLGSIKLEDISLEVSVEDISQILEDAVKLIKPYAEKSDVEVIIERFESLKIKCDRNKLKEVLLNLLDNAVKYRDPDKKQKHITISLENNKNEARLIIEDNGLGIKKDDLSNVFDRGFRVLDSGITRSPQVEGYGIGLAIVKNIIEKHNWKISVEGEYGSGSIFIITIPLS